jgi:hypothetical protein
MQMEMSIGGGGRMELFIGVLLTVLHTPLHLFFCMYRYTAWTRLDSSFFSSRHFPTYPSLPSTCVRFGSATP